MSDINRLCALKDPRNFARVIIGLSSLPPSKLGWDDDMQLRLQEKDSTHPPILRFCHSTDPKVKIHHYGATPYYTQWAIRVTNRRDGGDLEDTWYMTTQTLSATAAECMVGRATLVWTVKRLSDDMKTLLPVRLFY